MGRESSPWFSFYSYPFFVVENKTNKGEEEREREKEYFTACIQDREKDPTIGLLDVLVGCMLYRQS